LISGIVRYTLAGMKAIIVGAGLAGLTCVKGLRERGAEVAAFEASDDICGRVRTGGVVPDGAVGEVVIA
jgi:uncharacterized protein with NAD-binding domain and iron-sulfur cluster